MKKRLLILTVLSALFALSLSTTTLASNGPHIGPGFATNTDSCAGCHRAHTGVQAKLLKSGTNRYSFCTACHDGTGANANVVSGEFEGGTASEVTAWSSQLDGTPSAGLNAGGFESAADYTGRSSRLGDLNALSGDDQRHNVVSSGETTALAWGGGSTSNASGGAMTIDGFTCTSCHDPHGINNDDGITERYRMLKGSTAVPVNGKVTGAIKSHEKEALVFGKHDYTKDAYQTGLSDFCRACHTQYMARQGTVDAGNNPDLGGTWNAADGNGDVVRYRHLVGGLTNGNLDGIRGTGSSVWANLNGAVKLPVEQATYSADIKQADSVACVTCHQAHGTSATMTDNSKVGPANTSTLLRLPNRGVCQACHKK